MKGRYEENVARFALPIIAESTFSLIISQLFSMLVGGISGSALAGVGMINTLMSTLSSAMSFLPTGTGVLTSRLIGAGDEEQSARVAEQALLSGVLISFILTAFLELFRSPLMGLLLPSAEEAVRQECLNYFVILILSYPCVLLNNVMASLLRATGDSKSTMLSTVLSMPLLLLSGYILINRMGLGVAGTGLSYLICRVAGAAMQATACLKNRKLNIRPMAFFHPKREIMGHIFKVGLPASLSGLSVQMGYLLASTMVMALGTFEAAVYQVVVTLNDLINLPQTISIAMTVPLIGHALGAGEKEIAKKRNHRLLIIFVLVTLSLSTLVSILGAPLSRLYSSDPLVQEKAAKLIWIVVITSAFGQTLNVNDPTLQAGGEFKKCMIYNSIGVWMFRLPLSYLFCYILHFGALGMLLANIVSLGFRMVCGFWFIHRGKWLTKKV